MATKQAWQRSILDEQGNLLTSVQISVYLAGTETRAEIFEDLNGTEKSNPFSTGAQPVARFYANPGLYRVKAFKSGYGLQEWENVDISGDSVRRDFDDTINKAKALSKGFVSIAQSPYFVIGDGSDETVRFNQCLADHPGYTILVPSALTHYSVDVLNIPEGSHLIGVGRKDVYNPDSPDDLDGGATIRARGAGGLLNPLGVGVTIQDISLVGREDRALPLFSAASDPTRMRIIFTGVYFFSRGLGHETKPLRVFTVAFCHLSQNQYGARNLVDSRLGFCEVNANTLDGISQQTGANDTSFIANKVEWNGRHNWNFYQSNNCVISGGVTDRSGDHGFLLSQSSLTIDGGVVRRNGRNGGKSHFRLESNVSLLISGIVTRTGADDGGGGVVSPDYAVSGLYPNTGYTSFSNCDLSGYAIAPLEGAMGSVYFDSCNGVGDKQKPDAALSASIPSGGQSSISVGASFGLLAIPTFSVNTNKVRLTVGYRNASSGAVSSQELIISVNRGGSGGASASVVGRQDPESAAVNTSGAAVIVSFENVATDGKTFDIILSNTSAATAQIRAWAFTVAQA